LRQSIRIAIFLLVLAPCYCFAGTIISLSIVSSKFSIPCCFFKFDPVAVGSNSQGQFIIKNVSVVLPITYSVSIEPPFKVGLNGGTPQDSLSGSLAPAASVTVNVAFNNVPAGFNGKGILTIKGINKLGVTETITNWFATGRVVPKQPDLTPTIEQFTATQAQGTKRQVSMTVQITNKGFDQSPAPVVQISIDGRVEDTFTLGSGLSAGQGFAQSIQFQTSASGTNHQVQAFVDSNQAITEFDETNNKIVKTEDLP
jgi:CARDB